MAPPGSTDIWWIRTCAAQRPPPPPRTRPTAHQLTHPPFHPPTYPHAAGSVIYGNERDRPLCLVFMWWSTRRSGGRRRGGRRSRQLRGSHPSAFCSVAPTATRRSKKHQPHHHSTTLKPPPHHRPLEPHHQNQPPRLRSCASASATKPILPVDREKGRKRRSLVPSYSLAPVLLHLNAVLGGVTESLLVYAHLH